MSEDGRDNDRRWRRLRQKMLVIMREDGGDREGRWLGLWGKMLVIMMEDGDYEGRGGDSDSRWW